MKKFLNFIKIITCFSAITLLNSCGKKAVDNVDTKEFTVKDDPKSYEYPPKDFALVKDFTLYDAINFTKVFLKKFSIMMSIDDSDYSPYFGDDGSDELIDLVDIRLGYYLGNYNGYDICQVSFLNDVYKCTVSSDHVPEEKILEYCFDWESGGHPFLPRLVKDNELYTITSAYKNNIINEGDIKTIYDIWTTERSEYALNIGFYQSYSVIRV